MMRVLMRKLKDSSFGQLLTFLLLYVVVITLITQHYLAKETVPLENTQINLNSWTKLDRDSDKTVSLVDRLGELKSALIRAEKELELIKLAKKRANDCPQLPYLKLPQKLNAAPEYDNQNPLPDQRAFQTVNYSVALIFRDVLSAQVFQCLSMSVRLVTSLLNPKTRKFSSC